MLSGPISFTYLSTLSSHLHQHLSLGFTTKTQYSFLFPTMHSTCPTHLILHCFITLFWRKVCIMKLFMQFSLLPCHLVPLGTKYLPQYPIIKHPQHMFYPQCTDQFSHPYKLAPYILIFSVIFLWCSQCIIYLHNAGHPYKIWQSLLSRGWNIIALFWSQQFALPISQDCHWTQLWAN